MQIVRSPPAGLSTVDVVDLVQAMMARSLARVRFPPGDVRPAVAVRVDIEERAPDGRRELVVRLFDTGQVADPAGLKPFDVREELDLRLRREPPTGPWAGVFALRVAIEEGDPEPNPR